MTSLGWLQCSERDQARLASASSVIVLIGSYDGSGNFGDVLQARAAVQRVGVERPSAVAVVVEDGYADRDLLDLDERMVVLRYSDERGPCVVDRLPPTTLVYLYGGGYVNASWGARKLAHLEAVDRAVKAGSSSLHYVAATGLQISEHDDLWRWAPWLGSARPLGVRDRESIDILERAGLDRDSAMFWFDDAVGPLCERLAAPTDPDLLNVHVNVESYVTRNAPARLEAMARMVGTLAAARAGLAVQTIIAYDDDRLDEGPAADAFEALLDEGTARGEWPPISCDRRSLIDDLQDHSKIELGAAGTLTSSYHVGMASLLAGVPTILLAQNRFYSQKMLGLAATFGVAGTAVVDPEESVAADIVELLEAQRAPLAATATSTMERLELQRHAADWAIAAAAAEIERDAMWTAMQDVMPHHRHSVEQLSELYRRKLQLELAVDELGARVADARRERDEASGRS